MFLGFSYSGHSLNKKLCGLKGSLVLKLSYKGDHAYKTKVSCAKNPELPHIPYFKHEVGQNMASRALPTARNCAFLISALSVTADAEIMGLI